MFTAEMDSATSWKPSAAVQQTAAYAADAATAQRASLGILSQRVAALEMTVKHALMSSTAILRARPASLAATWTVKGVLRTTLSQ